VGDEVEFLLAGASRKERISTRVSVGFCRKRMRRFGVLPECCWFAKEVREDVDVDCFLHGRSKKERPSAGVLDRCRGRLRTAWECFQILCGVVQKVECFHHREMEDEEKHKCCHVDIRLYEKLESCERWTAA